MNRTIRPCGVDDLLQHRLEPLLELAAILGAGDQRAHVEGDDALVLQPLGHVAADDPLGQALDDRRLADARLADEHRVVLGAAGQHLDDPAHLLVAADDRIELAALGQRGQVAAVALERLVLALGVLIGDAMRAAHLGERRGHRLGGDAQPAQQLGGRRPLALADDGQEQVLGADELILHAGRVGLRLFEHPVAGAARCRARAAVGGRLALELFAHRQRHRGRGLAELLEQRRDDAAGLLGQRHQEMLGLGLDVRQARRQARRRHQRFLGLFGEGVEIHRRAVPCASSRSFSLPASWLLRRRSAS